MTTDTDYVDPADTPADLGDFLDQVGHEPLTASFSHATWKITRHGEQYAVNCFGPGGGWYNSRKMSRRALLSYLEAQDDLRLKRPEAQRPD
jgi:hypothetical protein